MRRPAIIVALLTAATTAPAARADYAVLRSGERLHITGYEQAGDHIRLTIPGGTLEVAASEIVSIEPEENFTANPPAPADDSTPYGKLIHDAAAKHGVDEGLIKVVIAAESNFNPRAVSRKQALGLMQLLPQTAARYSVANIFDPAQNIDAGAHYLKDLLEQYRGNLPLALAAYNAGPEMVERYGGIPPFRETQTYVRGITANLAKGQKASGGTSGTQASKAGPKAPKTLAKGHGSGRTTAAGTTGVAAGSAGAAAPSAAPGLD